MPTGDDTRLQFALQYSDQRSTGETLLRGADFAAYQWGIKAEFAAGNALLTAAYTSAAGDSDMQNPWSSYPGFTSVQVLNFNRDGEDAWMLRAAYNFPSIKGLSAYALWVRGSDPQDAGQFARDEYDFNLQWSPESGPLNGLMLRLRYARMSQDNPTAPEEAELRVMVFYDPPSL
jgi:predicted porin